MKKICCLLTAVVLLLTSCGGNKKGVGTLSSSPVKSSAKQTRFQGILEAVSYEGCITKDGFYYTEHNFRSSAKGWSLLIKKL